MTPSDAMETMVWIGDSHIGSVVPEAEALISTSDHGVTVGDGVFETLKVTRLGAFALTRHLHRLQRSCDHMGITMPKADLLANAVHEVLAVNAPVIGDLARLRITITSGLGPLGSERSTDDVTVIIATSAQKRWPEHTTLLTVPWTRNERSAITSVKSTSYAENVVALRYVHERDAGEGIFVNTVGSVCEGTGSNVFWVRDGRVFTPALSTGCLAGITRELVLEWFDVDEVAAPLSEAIAADEVFITSSTRDVQPVVAWDTAKWEGVGPVASSIQREFGRRAAETIDP
jgi:branched-chain amino acid aminotransferase